MRFGSVCSGIEAASVAFAPLGWKAAWLAEIEPFPSGVLAHHYPDVPNVGDMTAIMRRVLSGEMEAPDLFCGGTPCQAFSVAGKRQSLDDARGNLSLTFCEIADAIDHVRAARGADPCVVLWENVPGVLSTRDNAFGCFLGALTGADCELQPAGERWTDAGCVYGPARAVAWRVLDAQYFGLAQRRRRVFVVASARNGFDPAAVLFESDGVRRDTPPRREAREGTADGFARGAGDQWPHDVAGTLDAHYGDKMGLEDQHVYNQRASRFVPAIAFDTTQITSAANYSNPKPGDPCHPLAAGAHAPAVAFHAARNPDVSGGLAAPLGAQSSGMTNGVAYTTKLHNTGSNNAGKLFEERATCLDANSPPPALLTAMQVRRLTPRECERLQGFPDDYTRIPWRGKPAELCPDGPRYKALGNSWAVPVASWVGRRIARALA